METAIINGICRCCASEGAFKDIRSAYQWMGAEEIYADMLKECFDLSLWSSGEGDDGGICEVCVTQLRNASNFKKQVLHTEEQFKKHLHTRLFKPSIVKVELPANDGIDSDDNISAEEGYSGTDYEVSAIKVESPEESKPKKRSAKMSTRASTSRAKKAKGDAGESSTKRVTGSRVIKIERPSKAVQLKFVNISQRSGKLAVSGPKTDSYKNKVNLRNILLNSNASPIRCKDSRGYGCVFCMKRFEEPTALKKHFLQEHNNDKLIKYMTARIFEHVIKLDVTFLNCALCDTDIEKLEDLMAHLLEKHNKEVYMDAVNQIVPFRFDSPELRCVTCSTVFNTFKLLQEHMNSHFNNYICTICGAGFVTERLRQSHVKRHDTGEFKCLQCEKTFPNEIKRREHEKRTHLGMSKRNICKYCPERFVDYWKKMAHMVKEHGEPPVVLTCTACERTFNNQRALSRHTKKDHLMERRHKCTECDMVFFGKSSLSKHMAKHTGLRLFKCTVCFKAYGRKNTLREHMRIHANDRRFACVHCGQAFVQKCSWRSHMRSKHGEEV